MNPPNPLNPAGEREAPGGGAWDAIVLDLDGVLTNTAGLHFRAWKAVFDPLLAARGAEPFGREDYLRYVDGRPRLDGAAGFLEGRGIDLPPGEPGAARGEGSVNGLAAAKNERFQRLLEEEGVRVFPDARQRLRAWRARGLKLAVATSSRNGARVLRAAGLEQACDACVDGEDLAREGLPGKPDPDLFLLAARRLGVDPARTVLVEDAVAGVAAGRTGGFGLVVGLRREGDGAELRAAGADLVLRDLRGLGPDGAPRVRPADELPSLLERPGWQGRLAGRRLAVFLDYDGTLTPIVADPARALLAPGMRQALLALSGRHRTVVVSGRDRQDVAGKVAIPGLIYAGSHGFDIAGPGVAREHARAQEYLPALERAEGQLEEALSGVGGAQVERKRYALTVHFRNVGQADVPRVAEAARAAGEEQGLRVSGGRKIFELQPPVGWDKGQAVLWLRDALELAQPDVTVLYVGDDLTDEDAFLALRELREERGQPTLSLLVGCPERVSAADYRLPEDPAAVERLLRELAAV